MVGNFMAFLTVGAIIAAVYLIVKGDNGVDNDSQYDGPGRSQGGDPDGRQRTE